MLGSSSQIVVRRGRASDAKALADVFRESWRSAYAGIIPHHHLEAMIARRGAKWWTSAVRSRESLLVLSLAREVVGYATAGLSRTRGRIGKAEGEIYEIYVTPNHQGVGLGEHLFEGSRHLLELRGHAGLIIWCLADNHGAIDFYWRRGGRPVAETTENIGGSKLRKIAFEWN